MTTTETIITEAAEKYHNWGKWGDEDQFGTLNYNSHIEPARPPPVILQPPSHWHQVADLGLVPHPGTTMPTR